MKGRKREAVNRNILNVALFSDNIISRELIVCDMSSRSRHKSAISITLDNHILDFFSGKGRSGKINHILKQYLQARLSGEKPIYDDTPPKQKVAVALKCIQDEYGFDSLESKLIVLILERWRE